MLISVNKIFKVIIGSLVGVFFVFAGGLNAQCTNTTSTLTLSVCDPYVTPSGKYSWTTSGTYLDTILNYAGCDSVITVNLTILPTPIADFTINDDSQCENTNSFVFTNSSSVGLGKSLTYQWSFPDGNSATTTNVTKSIIKADGTYSVKLVSTSSDGCIDSISKNVSLLAKPLAKIFNTSLDSCLNSLLSFKADDLNAATFNSIEWVFPTSTSFTDSLVKYSFTSNGSKTIEARVTNVDGCVDTTSINVNIYNNPTSQFSVNTADQCFQGHDFDFSNSSVSNLTNTSLTYTWAFGDATNSAAANPSKTYSDTGNRTVSLIATNVLGCADTNTLAIRVSVNPEALFTVNDTNQCLVSHSFYYTNSSRYRIWQILL